MMIMDLPENFSQLGLRRPTFKILSKMSYMRGPITTSWSANDQVAETCLSNVYTYLFAPNFVNISLCFDNLVTLPLGNSLDMFGTPKNPSFDPSHGSVA